MCIWPYTYKLQQVERQPHKHGNLLCHPQNVPNMKACSHATNTNTTKPTLPMHKEFQ